jgi:hypothetical protein
MEWMIPSLPRTIGPLAPILHSSPYVPLLATLIVTNKVIISLIPKKSSPSRFIWIRPSEKAVRAGERVG